MKRNVYFCLFGTISLVLAAGIGGLLSYYLKRKGQEADTVINEVSTTQYPLSIPLGSIY